MWFKRKYRVILWFIVGSLSAVDGLAADLILHLKGRNYSKLDLSVTLCNYERVNIPGLKQTDTWYFHIPDSIYEMQNTLDIRSVDSVTHYMTFVIDDKKRQVDFSLCKGCTELSVNYIGSNEIRDNIAFGNKTVIFDEFGIQKPTDEMIAFWRVNYDRNANNFTNFLSEVKSFSHTHFALAYIYNNYYLFNRKQLKQLYHSLSPELQKSLIGEKINNFLLLKEFPNIQLTTLDNNYTSIIQDFRKYTLVVFSASWCKPCRDEIPVLLKLYQDLHTKGLNIIYVSIDKQNTVPAWKGMIKSYKIPWKSFLAYKEMNKVNDLYMVRGIPMSYLVYPTKKFIKIDIRQKEQRQLLYNLFSKRK